jgi:hypothetical protein
MKNNRNKDYEWTLTVVRDGRQGLVKNADAAEFKFGRWRKELDKSNIKNIPDGFITLLRHLELEDTALESGFLVRMSTVTQKGSNWTAFKKVVVVENWDIGPPKAIYSGPLNLCSLEVELVYRCVLPDTIWVTVEELPESTLAWIFGKGLLLNYEGKQATLHEWCEFPDGLVPKKTPPLTLPGPPDFRYHFFGD